MQMTATHITTAFWHTKHVWDLSYKVMSADLELLKQRGYTLPRDIKAVKPFLAGKLLPGLMLPVQCNQGRMSLPSPHIVPRFLNPALGPSR